MFMYIFFVQKSALEQQVYEQWLLSDLSESGVSCLPPELASIAKTQIPNFLPLQVIEGQHCYIRDFIKILKVLTGSFEELGS